MIDLQQIWQMAGMFIFVLFIFYGARIQLFQMSLVVKQKLVHIEVLRKKTRDILVYQLTQYGAEKVAAEKFTEKMVKSFAIMPISHLDPAGLTDKLHHTLKTYDAYMKSQLSRLLPTTSVSNIQILENQLEVALVLDQIYRIVNHYYLLGKKAGGLIWMYQLSMMMNVIMELAEAYGLASEAFPKKEPIGDGFGPMVAKRFADGQLAYNIADETSIYNVAFEDRTVRVLKAEGPGGTVGNIHQGIDVILQSETPVAFVSVDATLRLEGETTGEVVEGVGVAMGGAGPDRFYIEEASVKHGIPLFCVVCKMTNKEAITTMAKEIFSKVDEAVERVKEIIRQVSQPGDVVVLIGVGNTTGVA